MMKVSLSFDSTKKIDMHWMAIYHLMGMRFPIFRQVQNNYRFGWKRHIDPA
jgi:hypothetical protein